MTIIIVGLFLLILGLNIYLRVYLMKDFKYLVRNKVDFEISHVFNTEKRHMQLYPKYNQHKMVIESFSKKIVDSLKIFAILLVTIILLGLINNYVL